MKKAVWEVGQTVQLKPSIAAYLHDNHPCKTKDPVVVENTTYQFDGDKQAIMVQGRWAWSHDFVIAEGPW